MTDFAKPPVAEIWFSFEFESSSESTGDWESSARSFMDAHKGELPELHVVNETNLEMVMAGDQWPQFVVKGVKLTSARRNNVDRTRAMHLEKELFSVHCRRSGTAFPRYSTAKEFAEPLVLDYVQRFQPARIRTAALHYLDLIEIPAVEDRNLALQDYFVPAPDLPSIPFGDIAHFSFQYQFGTASADEGPMQLSLKTVPFDPDARKYRFRLDWHKQTRAFSGVDLIEAWAELDAAHQHLRRCFDAAFRQRTLDLFEPIREPGENAAAAN